MLFTICGEEYKVTNKMVNATLITWAIFIAVFGGYFGYQLVNWWMGGGFKKWLKYKHDLKKEKERLAQESDSDSNQIKTEPKEKGE